MATRRGPWHQQLIYLLLIAAGLSGCAYGFQPGRVRPGLESISVPFFENRSREPDVEILLTQAIVAGITADRTLKVVDSDQADTELRGILQKYEFVESFFSDERTADEYKVRIVVQVTMLDRQTQDPIIGPKTVTGEGTYLLEDGPEGESAAREVATREIVEGILNMVIEEW